MREESAVSTDIGLGVTLILVALVTIYGTLELPEGSFEPLGSASIPQYVCGGIIVLSLWIIARAMARSRLRTLTRESSDDIGNTFPTRPGLACALMCIAVVYVAVMAMDWVRFSIATAVFTFVTVAMLSSFERRLLPAIVVLALVLGIGLEFMFTRVFVIDLP